MKLPVLLVAFCGLAAAAEGPRLFYSKSVPGSVPAYTEISLERSGDGLYKEAVDDESPLKFKLMDAEVNEVFGLADKLDHFSHPLESGLKVAFMGTKTLRWENGAERHEAKFNFAEDLNARALHDWFERMAESEQQFINLQRAAKYDKLGVYQALLLLEASLDRKRLVATSQYLPLLDRIVKNESYMHAARARAAGIVDIIHGVGAQTTAAEPAAAK
jgi:hypothetical protein